MQLQMETKGLCVIVTITQILKDIPNEACELQIFNYIKWQFA